MLIRERFLKRLQKKAKKGVRGWPVATIAYYGPDGSRASKVAVGIIPSQGSEVSTIRAWHVEQGDIRSDSQVAQEVLTFIEVQGARSVAMTSGLLGCPHQEGIDYEGENCPQCDYWRGRDRSTGDMIQ